MLARARGLFRTRNDTCVWDDHGMPEIPWVPIASLFGLVGAFMQARMAFLGHLDSMSEFLRAHNELTDEQQIRVRGSVARWRLLKRRRLLNQARLDANIALTPSEQRKLKRYDGDITAWSTVLVAAIILTIAAFVDFYG